MDKPTQELLFGYLLDVLEDGEHERVEQCLHDDPALRQELAHLEKCLEPLESTQNEWAPPAGLAARTCQKVASRIETLDTIGQSPSRSSSMPCLPTMTPITGPAVSKNSLRWSDVGVIAGILAASVLLILPAIYNGQMEARLQTCQDHLGQIGMALTEYSENHNGYFPTIPTEGNLAVAGAYAPILAENGLLDEPSLIVCPTSNVPRLASIPSLQIVRQITSPEQLAQMQKSMGGSYNYCLGHVRNGIYRGTKNLRRGYFVLMADAPGSHRLTHSSVNHGNNNGQNVLYEDGRVRYVVSAQPLPNGDDFYVNDAGRVAAGIHVNDSVVGASDASPKLP